MLQILGLLLDFQVIISILAIFGLRNGHSAVEIRKAPFIVGFLLIVSLEVHLTLFAFCSS